MSRRSEETEDQFFTQKYTPRFSRPQLPRPSNEIANTNMFDFQPTHPAMNPQNYNQFCPAPPPQFYPNQQFYYDPYNTPNQMPFAYNQQQCYNPSRFSNNGSPYKPSSFVEIEGQHPMGDDKSKITVKNIVTPRISKECSTSGLTGAKPRLSDKQARLFERIEVLCAANEITEAEKDEIQGMIYTKYREVRNAYSEYKRYK